MRSDPWAQAGRALRGRASKRSRRTARRLPRALPATPSPILRHPSLPPTPQFSNQPRFPAVLGQFVVRARGRGPGAEVAGARAARGAPRGGGGPVRLRCLRGTGRRLPTCRALPAPAARATAPRHWRAAHL